MDKVYIVYDTNDDGECCYTNFYGVYATEQEAAIKAKIHKAYYREETIETLDITKYKYSDYYYRLYLAEDEEPNTYYIKNIDRLRQSHQPLYEKEEFYYSFSQTKSRILTPEGKRKQIDSLELMLSMRTDRELWKLGSIELKDILIEMINERATEFQLTKRDAYDFNV